METQSMGSTEPQLEEILLSQPIKDAGTDWDRIQLRPATAGDLWKSPAGALAMPDQALVTARRVHDLKEHRFAPWCRELHGPDFAMICRLGTEVVFEYNRGQTEMNEQLEGLDGTEPIEFDLEDGFRGRTADHTEGEAPLVRAVKFRTLRGGDVWNTPPDNLTIGDLAAIASRAIGFPEPFVKRCTPSDLGRLTACAAVFLMPFRQTGETR